MFFNNKDSQNETHHLQERWVNARRVQAKKAISLSFFATLLVSGAVSAGTLYDKEDNSRDANQVGIFQKGNARIEAHGYVSNTDKIDLYSIKNYESSKTIDWSFYPKTDAMRMYVYKDLNFNQIVDSSDTFLFGLSKKNMSKSVYSSYGSNYVAMIHNTSAPGQNSYSMYVNSPMTVRLNVISAKSYGKFDGVALGGFGRKSSSKPDFYVKTRINNGSNLKSRTVGNNNTPVFNHRHTGTLSPFGGIVPLSIDLYDSDRGSRDDRADIHPDYAKKRLDLVYDLIRNQIRTDDGRVLGKPGQAITVKGIGPKAQASVTFVVR